MTRPSMFMEIALAQAAAAALCGEVPVGAVIVTRQGEVVAKAGNSVCRDKDPTAPRGAYSFAPCSTKPWQ